MLLTAQRVVSPATRARGINVYQYLHGHIWPGRVPDEFLPDVNPGELVGVWEQLPGGGNHVVSFLDVVAPDGMEPLALHQHLASLKYQLPSLVQVGAAAYLDPCWARFGTSATIPPEIEVGALAGAIVLRLTGR